MKKIIDFFIHESAKLDKERHRTGQMVIIFSFLSSIIFFMMTMANVSKGYIEFSYVNIIAYPVLVLCVSLIKFLGKTRLAAVIYCLNLYIFMVSIALLSGGAESPQMSSFGLVVMLAVILLGFKGGSVFMGLIATGNFTLMYLTKNDLIIQNLLNPAQLLENRLADSLAVSISLLFGLSFYEWNRKSMLEKIEIEKENLAKAKNQIEQKSLEMQTMFANLEVGICVIGPEFRLRQAQSDSFKKMFQEELAQNLPVYQILGLGSDLNEEQISGIEQSILSMINMDSIAFDLNNGGLPTSINRKGKILELDWLPIVNKDEIIEAIMLSVRDITERKKLEELQKKADEQITKIVELISNNPSQFPSFYNSCQNQLKSLYEKSEDMAYQKRSEHKRSLHTIKGNARLMGLSILSAAVHNIESDYVLLDENKGNESRLQFLNQAVFHINSILEEYKNVFDQHFQQIAPNSEQFAQNLMRPLEDIGKNFEKDHGFKAPLIEMISSLSEGGNYLSFIIEDKLQSIAKRKGFSSIDKIKVNINPHDFVVKKSALEEFDAIFTHVLNNSVDHGNIFELSSEISIQLSSSVQSFEIFYSDGGAGLNLKKIKQISGIEDNQKAAEYTFKSGASTAVSVTDSSGRGVGMEAVKAMVENLHGSLELVLGEPNHAGNHCFQFKFTFPNSLISTLHTPENFKKAA